MKISTSLEGELIPCPGNLSSEDQLKYGGQYVCIVSFSDHMVVAADSDPAVALEEARKKGYENPIVFYVPSSGERFAFLETAEAITFR